MRISRNALKRAIGLALVVLEWVQAILSPTVTTSEVPPEPSSGE